jgi:hypothetical protein
MSLNVTVLLWYSLDRNSVQSITAPILTAERAEYKLFLEGTMKNIYDILKDFGLEIPEEKKADFDKAVIENYKTVAEVDKLKNKLTTAETDRDNFKKSLDDTTKAFDDLKNSNASSEDWKKKYTDLVEEHDKQAKERAAQEQLEQERAEFDNYFVEKGKEWHDPMIADGYFAKFREAKALPENKSKMSADILHELTKDSTTAFKVAQPIVNLKGASAGIGGSDIDDARINAIMGITTN